MSIHVPLSSPPAGASRPAAPTIRVFDPTLCCSTGVCGPDVDADLIRFAADLDWLKREGVTVERFNLAQQPAAFVAEPLARKVLQDQGEVGLPLVIVNGEMRISGSYPSRELLVGWAGLRITAAAWDERVAELVAIGAAVASHCVSCLSAHEQRARTLGISPADVRRAMETGRAVREASAARVEQHAARLLEKRGAPLPQAEEPSACCGPTAGARGGSTSSSCC